MPTAYTMNEAAAELRKSRRWLQDWLASNPVDAMGRPYYSTLGRSKMFRPADIERILDATRVQCLSNSDRRDRVKRRTTASVARISDSGLLKLAAELTNDPSLLKNSVASSASSSSTASIQSRKPELKVHQGGRPS